MNGGQDLGGVMGFGPVIDEPNEPVFHQSWESRVLAMVLAMSKHGLWNIDKGRYARENRPPSHYLNWSYYQIWLAGLETLLDSKKTIAMDEREACKSAWDKAARATPHGKPIVL